MAKETKGKLAASPQYRERRAPARCDQLADVQLREAAKVMLKVKDVNIAKPGATVRLPRSRR